NGRFLSSIPGLRSELVANPPELAEEPKSPRNSDTPGPLVRENALSQPSTARTAGEKGGDGALLGLQPQHRSRADRPRARVSSVFGGTRRESRRNPSRVQATVS